MANPVSDEDLPFQHYTLKHRLIAWISMHLFDNAIYTVRHGLLKGMKRKGGLGWIPSKFSGGILTAEEQFWTALKLKGLVVYDIGAFQGLLTLFFAAQAEMVVAFEPNSQNRKRLMENLTLNGIKNVKVRNIGVGSLRETRRMLTSPLMPGGASLEERIQQNLLQTRGKAVVEEVAIVTLDQEIRDANLPVPDFIKIDTEGWEIEVLRGAHKTLEMHKPTLFLEMHGETMREKRRKVAEIVTFLWELNYHRIHHVESGATITPENTATAAEGHLYCEGLALG